MDTAESTDELTSLRQQIEALRYFDNAHQLPDPVMAVIARLADIVTHQQSQIDALRAFRPERGDYD